MYKISDALNTTSFQGLQVGKLVDVNAQEILQISLEAASVFPKHTSPRDAFLIVLEGEISFFINNAEYKLLEHQVFNFPKNEEHWVEAKKNSKFLIIR